MIDMNRLQEIRIECVKIAASRGDIKPDEIVEVAREIEAYVRRKEGEC